MRLNSLKNCQLQIGSYPVFYYNANGGGGKGTIKQKNNQITEIVFNPDDFNIPPLTWQTTKIGWIPMAPGLKIQMECRKLEGEIDLNNGDFYLDFESIFVFSIMDLIKFPGLLVKSNLNTSHVIKNGLVVHGETIQKDGFLKLVGIAEIAKTENKLLNSFLGLPNQALAILNCRIEDN